jgi:hypothetical protein
MVTARVECFELAPQRNGIVIVHQDEGTARRHPVERLKDHRATLRVRQCAHVELDILDWTGHTLSPMEFDAHIRRALASVATLTKSCAAAAAAP